MCSNLTGYTEGKEGRKRQERRGEREREKEGGREGEQFLSVQKQIVVWLSRRGGSSFMSLVRQAHYLLFS